MKKIFTILAAVAVVSLAACNSKTDEAGTADSTANVSANDSGTNAPVTEPVDTAHVDTTHKM